METNLTREELKKKLISMSIKVASTNDKTLKGVSVQQLKIIIAENGFPSVSSFGEGGARAAWVVVQHSDDLEFMKDYLELMKKHSDDVDKELLASLEDRICILEGRPQIYGTQMSKNPRGWKPKPIKDPDNVNARRKELGLNTLEAHMAYLESI